MKIVLQRVTKCTVKKGSQKISKIGPGYVLLVGFQKEQKINLDKVVQKILKIKLFENWKKNIREMDYEIMILSQFTLFGQFKGNKPDFHLAEEHFSAKKLFYEFIEIFKNQYSEDKIKCGIFGEYLAIELVNDGPVTMIFEYDK